ncbi:MAG: translation elongation factor 4 [Candidatus Levybacteria bacterium]|nr:translation elongation factor 4 [Candidatus Levybacteria bacterium]
MSQNNIRNFAIIAHVDHGKSTLADRLLVMTNTIRKEDIGEQFLDSSAISKERGITIKLAPVRMNYSLNGQDYVLDLIDTPGHVDFSYEVVRTLYACEGAVLLVDATKGIQAQTVANLNYAKKIGLTIVPAINKIDLPMSRVDEVEKTMVESLGFEKSEILYISAKTGEGVEDLLAAVIERVPSPSGEFSEPTQAYIFDSVYDEHRGIVIFVRLENGKIKKGDEIVFLSDNSRALVMDVGFMKPTFNSSEELVNGEVGYVITNVKDITQAKVGDTMTTVKNPGVALPGFLPLKPFVYLSIYPSSNSEFQNLRKAVYKIKLNDAALTIAPEHSTIFGPGFRCGFLGLLHSQIVIERLEREEGVDVFTAPPTIEYKIDGKSITSPKDFDNGAFEMLEPFIDGEIYVPAEYVGNILEIVNSRRGRQTNAEYFESLVKLSFEMPLAAVVYDFYDKIKSASSGYASFDYDIKDFRQSKLVRVDIYVNEQVISELSFIVHTTEVESFSRRIVEVLASEIPKHNFVIAVRAQVGGKIIASERISALRKDVTAKLYGGDRTRKDKLLEAQKKGKAKMKTIGNVNVPKEAFLSVLKV